MIASSEFQGKRAKYFTLGCKLNFSETSTFGKLLGEMGVQTAEKGEPADICLINTCSVTEVADHKCRQAIHRLVRENPEAFVVHNRSVNTDAAFGRRFFIAVVVVSVDVEHLCFAHGRKKRHIVRMQIAR